MARKVTMLAGSVREGYDKIIPASSGPFGPGRRGAVTFTLAALVMGCQSPGRGIGGVR